MVTQRGRTIQRRTQEAGICTAETPSRNAQEEREGSLHQQIKLPGVFRPPAGMCWLPGPWLWLDEESLAGKGKGGSTATADSPGGFLPALFQLAPTALHKMQKKRL